MSHMTLHIYAIVITLGLRSGCAMADSWVWPTLPTGTPVHEAVSVTEKYGYTISNYRDVRFDASSAKDMLAEGDGPEAAFVARMRAMMSLDYDEWVATWDPASWVVAKEKYDRDRHDKAYWLDQWRTQFVHSTVQMLHRIETGPYRIITYRVLDAQGRDLSGGFVMPSVFKRVNGKWMTTLDLRRDPLITYSPWVSGNDSLSVTVK